MYRLLLFGGISLEDSSGPVSGRVVQRRQLAMLSVLASSRSRNTSREKLVGLLWPERPEESARHLLADALYVIRRELGKEVILTPGDQLRLDPSAVWSDVGEFHAALARSERVSDPSPRMRALETAASLYRGPFLDGFYLPDARAFEEWMEGERRRLAGQYLRVLEVLAEGAEAREAWSTAVDWWKRRAAHEPTNSRVAARLIEALATAGDVAGAVRQARIHERLLEEEMGLEPPQEVRELAERLAKSGDGEFSAPARLAASSAPRPAVGGTAESTQGAGTGGAAAGVEPDEGPAAASRRASRRLLGRRTVIMIGLVALALSAVFAGGLSFVDGGREELEEALSVADRRASIAVLPFEDLGRDPRDAHVAGGLHEEILTQLSKVAALRVIGRTSVRGYAGPNVPLERIASELGVGSVVEGGVQVAGERLRVNVRLIDAATGANLWAERYDRTLDDVFAIQSDVAQRIVAAVGAALSRAEQQRLAAAPTADPEAYRFYLQGRDYFARPGRSRQNWEIAEQLYERALALDPGFALARAELSKVNGWTYFVRYDPSPERLVRQREEAEAAVRLAPELPQAHIAMGLWHYWGRRDYERALEEFSIALEGLPNDPWLWQVIGAVHRRLGNWDEVLAAFDRAVRLDPRDADLVWDLGGNTYSVLRRYAEAVAAYDRALSLAPDMHNVAIAKGWAYALWQGQLDTLRAALDRVRDDPGPWREQVTEARPQVLLMERNADGLLQFLEATRLAAFSAQLGFLPRALFAAWAHRLRGDAPSARAAFDSALTVTDSAMRVLPDDWRVHVARGLVLAGLGRRDDALGEARWLQRSAAYREDAHGGPFVAIQRAQVLAQAGEADQALDEIERLLTIPSLMSVPMLRLDPIWDPIRDHPRFQRLVGEGRSSSSSSPASFP